MSVAAIYFNNVSNEDFTGKWDSVEYTVKTGEKALLQSYIATSLAKDLAMREMGKRDRNAPIDPSTNDAGQFTNEVFKNEVNKYLLSSDFEEETPEKLEIAMIVEKKKPVRPKKEKVEEEFPDLNKK